MKIGVSPAFLFTHYGSSLGVKEFCDCIRMTAEDGFAALGMEIYSEQQYPVMTSENAKIIRKQFDNYGVASDCFTAFAVQKNINSLDPEVRKQGLRDFEALTRWTAEIGLSSHMELVNAAPHVMEVASLGAYPNGPAAEIAIPENYTWNDIWDITLTTTRKCLDIVKKYGLNLSIEPLPMSIVANSDAFLRFWAELNDPCLGVTFDPAHLHYQRESVSVAIEKLKDHIFGFCVSDNDSTLDYHLPPGEGTINWEQTLKTLKKIGYNGTLDVEILADHIEKPNEVYVKCKTFLEDLLARI